MLRRCPLQTSGLALLSLSVNSQFMEWGCLVTRMQPTLPAVSQGNLQRAVGDWMRPQSAGPVVSSVVSYWGTNLGSQSKQNVFIGLSRNWIWSWPRLSDWQKISSRELSEEMRQLWESEALTMASGGGRGKSNWVSATCQVPNLVRCFQGLI